MPTRNQKKRKFADLLKADEDYKARVDAAEAEGL